ncbi:MAG: aminotransferase class I/II-fold pyridoxal phosphate-dependent enzyme [Leifsonia sp.]|nr:aminotransferase class I/II-fold pyridoxal phosphate-dependent enzyme [Leifsonia sp.]MDQ1587563.1 cysteine-S-conjugate beta-lyase [Microbacteriaceae bacterium]
MIEVHAEPLQSLRERTSEKWRAYPEDVIPLFVAEMDYPLAEPIAEALTEAVRRSDTGYARPGGELPRAFADFAARRWGWQVDPAQVTTTADVAVVVVEALRLAIRPGDGVVINTPVYPPFFDFVPEAGGRIVEVPLLQNAAGWSIDLDGVERAFAAGARAYLLCNPHNPLGHPHPADQLAAVAELAARYGVTVVSDEIHAPLTLSDGVFTPFLSVSDAAREHGIAAESASKAWNLAGLKCAMFVTAGERMSRLLATLPESVRYRTGLFGQIASAVAFAEGEEWLDGAIRALERNRDALTTLLAEKLPGVGYLAPRASYLAWLDFRALGWGDDPSIRALESGRVALSSGPMFGTQGAGFARLNFACSPEVLGEAVDRLAGA